VTVVVQSDIRPWRYPPLLDFQYGDWLRTDFEKGNFGPSPTPFRPDLALLITMAVAANTTLAGTPPAEVFPTVPHEDVLRAMASDIDRLRGDIDSDTRNVILTLARMWSTFVAGALRSKDAAADWALGQLPVAHHRVLVRARDAYLGIEPEKWDDLSDSIAPCVGYMIAEIERRAALPKRRRKGLA
jgi:streptomycin 3"-adenylyltransferase